MYNPKPEFFFFFQLGYEIAIINQFQTYFVFAYLYYNIAACPC